MFWRRRKKREKDLERELRSHLELESEEQEEKGLSSTEAPYAAQRAFGNAALIKEEVREMWGFTFVQRLGHDIRYALRGLGANPGFTVAAVLTMALGIGANTAIFSVVNAALLRPLPYPDPQRLVALSDTVQGTKNWPSTYLNYLDWKRQNSAFEAIAAYQGESYNVDHGGAVDRVRAWNVSAEFFRTLKVTPALGRDFEPDDDKPGASPVLQITYGLWQRWFSANPAVLGSALDIGGRGFTIIGVLPKNFQFYEDASLYSPLGLWAGQMQGRSNHSILLSRG